MQPLATAAGLITGAKLLLLGFCYVIGLRLMIAEPTEHLIKVIAQAATDALASAHIDPKVLTAPEYWNCSLARVYQVLSGDPRAPLTVVKAINTPPMFWVYFGPWLAARVVQRRMREAIGVEQ